MPALKILIIEDDEDLLELLSFTLESEGFAVTCAQSSEDACEVLDLMTFDLIVSDIHINGIDAYRLMAILREGGVRSPAIAMSGDLNPQECQDAGFQASIAKPFGIHELMNVVNANMTFDLSN